MAKAWTPTQNQNTAALLRRTAITLPSVTSPRLIQAIVQNEQYAANANEMIEINPLEWKIIVLLPRVLEPLVAQLPEPQRNPPPCRMRIDHLVDVPA